MAEHVKVSKKPPGKVPEDRKTIRWKNFSPEPENDACSPCPPRCGPSPLLHSRGSLFRPFRLITLEDPDFYSDGGTWGKTHPYSLAMSPCVKSGKLDCIHCHTLAAATASRRTRRQQRLPALPFGAGQQCPGAHETPGRERGNKCISCHMPMTEFAFMRRSDHSMLPPAPTMTILLKSPNACNLCHKDRDAQWLIPGSASGASGIIRLPCSTAPA